jgi:oligopeptidase B
MKAPMKKNTTNADRKSYSSTEAAVLEAPKPAKRPRTFTQHGDTRSDDYFWLREKDNPEVIAHLNAENAHTERSMADTKALQKTLFGEMKSRIKETDQSASAPSNGYHYYSRTEAGKQYSMLYRRKGSMDAPEELVLDLNKLAKGHKFLRLGVYEFSPDNTLLAYALDYDGSRKYTLYIKNCVTGKIVETLQGTHQAADKPSTGGPVGALGNSFCWANDSKTMFYNVYDAAMRSYKIFRHTVGTPRSNDVEVFHERDEKFDVSVGKTRSSAYILLSAGSTTTSEWWMLDANTPQGTFSVVEPRKTGHEYSVEHHGSRLLILSNSDNATNFRLLETPVTTPSQAHWKEIIAHRSTTKLEDVDAFAEFVVLTERENGMLKFRIIAGNGASATSLAEAPAEPHYVSFPEASYDAGLGNNEDYATSTLRYTYVSLTTPYSSYDYDMRTRKQTLVKRQEVPGGATPYTPDDYVSERLYATAPDGVKVPVSLVYKKGLQRNGANPTLLYGYGSYGIPMDVNFASTRLSLLDRGFVFAIAHIRGGGDLGKQWYLDGKFLKKKNTFTDFIAAAEFLIAEKFTQPAKLVIEGRSAGGLLMGAVTNMRPDLFKAVHMGVAFVDVINTMNDTTLPLTTGEYEEWGNPNDKEYYDYMKSYAPYENVRRTNYPSILFTTGLHDSQVPYWEPTKHAAKIREYRTDNNPIVMKIDMSVGHGGASGRYDALKERAFELAFFLKELGMNVGLDGAAKKASATTKSTKK